MLTDPALPAVPSPPADSPGPDVSPDPEGFGPWYAEHWEPALRFASRLVGDSEDGADIAASVLVDVWSRWQITGLPDAPDAYLFRALRNRVASHFQRRDRERAVTERLRAFGPATAASPEAAVADRETVADLLDRLPADERRTVTLRYLADLPATETARVLGIRPASVRSRVHRTRRRLADAA
jgi:RNA polymerase sigma-70 factor, ECF subfamily